MDPKFQQKQLKVYLNPVAESTKQKKKKENCPKTELTWQAIIYSEETHEIQTD